MYQSYYQNTTNTTWANCSRKGVLNLIAFLVVANLGWGKGKSLTEAIKNYTKYNHNINGKYQLCIFDCKTQKDFDFIEANEFVFRYNKNTKLLYKGIEK